MKLAKTSVEARSLSLLMQMVFAKLISGLGLSEQEELRARLLDRLLPMSVPFSEYQRWKERFPILSGPPVPLEGAVIMVGSGAAEDTLESLNEQTHDKWLAASLPRTHDPLGFRTELAQEFLSGEAADCDFIVFTLAGTMFEPSALHRIANAFVDFPEAQVVYADVDLQSEDGSIWPLAFPAFDYERMLEQGYCACLFAMRRGTAERLLQPALQIAIACLIQFWISEKYRMQILFTFPDHWRRCLNSIGRQQAKALAAAARAHLRQKGIRAQATFHAAGVTSGRANQTERTTVFLQPSLFRRAIANTCYGTVLNPSCPLSSEHERTF